MAKKTRINPFSNNSAGSGLSPRDKEKTTAELVEELRSIEKSLGKEKFKQLLKKSLNNLASPHKNNREEEEDYWPNPVTISEWSATHPANLKCKSDEYYADLANELRKLISTFRLPPGIPSDVERELGIVLAKYLEDLVSGTKVFSAMRRVCSRKYGYPLPFYDCDHPEYMPDHLNIEDIRFLIWSTFCQLGKGCERTYSPLAPGWELIADRFFDELNSRYEEAPEAALVADWLHRAFRKEDYILIRETARWMVFSNPLTYKPGYLASIYSEMDELRSDPEYSSEYINQIAYGVIASRSWQRSMSAMGCSSSMLVAASAAELGYDSVAAEIEKIEVLPRQIYAISRDNKTRKIIFEDSAHKRFEVRRDSFAKDFKPDRYLFGECNLVKFKEEYLLNGSLQYSPLMKEEWETGLTLLSFEQKHAQVKQWIEMMDGKQVLCVTNIHRLLKDLGFSGEKDNNIPKAKNYIVILSFELGFTILPDMGYAFDIPGNRFFRKRKAYKESFPDIIFQNSLPFDVASYIEENHLLPEACIGASQGKETGLRIVQDYLAFWIGFYCDLPPYGNAR